MYRTIEIEFNQYSGLTEFINKSESEGLRFVQVIDIFRSGNSEKIHRAAILFIENKVTDTKLVHITRGDFNRCYTNISIEQAIENFCESKGFKSTHFAEKGYTAKEVIVQTDF